MAADESGGIITSNGFSNGFSGASRDHNRDSILGTVRDVRS